VRIEGDNRPGVAAEVTEKLTAAGINLRGFSAAVIGARFIFYIGLDSTADAEKAANILQQA
jgi:predicted amino acid-binding ACT domain protein